MNKYIFLDIDGPLNTERDENKDPERYGHRFDNEAVENLREIVEATGASIVTTDDTNRASLVQGNSCLGLSGKV